MDNPQDKPSTEVGKRESSIFANVLLLIVIFRVVVIPLAALILALSYITIDYYTSH